MDNKKKILVAEDEKAMARALEAKLLRSGYEVTIAENGDQALLLLKNDTYNLIILDLMMPKKNGFDVLEELRKRGNTVPVVVSSNLGQDNDIKTALELGAKDYFVKSDTPIAEIIQRIQKIIS
ncbi:MAG: response regulator [Patescibacteria group bacterium]